MPCAVAIGRLRFLEPRFEKARADTRTHLCIHCHREHSQVRVTAPAGSYCASCHQELQVRNDRATPSHASLVAQKRWETWMQCHHYHGNHVERAPQRLHDGATPEQLDPYLKDGPLSVHARHRTDPQEPFATRSADSHGRSALSCSVRFICARR